METLRRQLGQAFAELSGKDLGGLFGTEVGRGIYCGIEDSIHELGKLYGDKPDHGFKLLLIDAKSALNSYNRNATLLNASKLWSIASNFLYDSYQDKQKRCLRTPKHHYTVNREIHMVIFSRRCFIELL